MTECKRDVRAAFSRFGGDGSLRKGEAVERVVASIKKATSEMEVLAAPPTLAHISGLVLCPAGCLGGVRPDAFEPVEGSDCLERVLGPECPTCGGTGIDPSCYEGCCDPGEEHDQGAVIVLGEHHGFRPAGA